MTHPAAALNRVASTDSALGRRSAWLSRSVGRDSATSRKCCAMSTLLIVRASRTGETPCTVVRSGSAPRRRSARPRRRSAHRRPRAPGKWLPSAPEPRSAAQSIHRRVAASSVRLTVLRAPTPGRRRRLRRGAPSAPAGQRRAGPPPVAASGDVRSRGADELRKGAGQYMAPPSVRAGPGWSGGVRGRPHLRNCHLDRDRLVLRHVFELRLASRNLGDASQAVAAGHDENHILERHP